MNLRVVVSDPIFNDVQVANVIDFSNRFYAIPDLDAGATLLADNGHNTNMIARNAVGNIIAMNIYPRFNTNSDAARLYANALLSVQNLTIIEVSGGLLQECAQDGGSEIRFTLSPGRPEVDMVEWFLDQESVGFGETVETFVTLGEHTIGAVVSTAEGKLFTASQRFEVIDTTKPEIALSLTETTGSQGKSRSRKATVHFDVFDACDPGPVVTAMAGSEVADGETLRIKTQKGEVTVPGETLTVTVTATDASGNMAQEQAVLP